MTTCHKCGTENRDGAKYCDSCGATIDIARIWNGETPSLEEGEAGDGGGWSKSMSLGEIYKSTVDDGPGGAHIKTRFSLFGFSETSTYPRWMITSLAFLFVALLLVLGYVVISAALVADRIDYVALGFALVGFALLLGYVFYRFYYAPPRRNLM
jgi:hypothetical protein